MAKDFKSMERAIALILGDWWGVPFRRTPSSGAWNTQSRNMGHGSTDFHGDIVAPPEADFPFSVECKAYKEVEIYKAMYAQSNIFEWWDQCITDAKEANKIPMMVMKENRKEALVAIPVATWITLKSTLKLQREIYATVMQLSFPAAVGKRVIVVMGLKHFVAIFHNVDLIKKVLNAK